MFGRNLSQPTQTMPLFPEVRSTHRRRKRGTERRTSQASLEAFERIKQRRVKIYLPILETIAEHGPGASSCLTAREILRKLKAAGVLSHDAERNHISPRLTELLEAGCVENPDSFLKDVPGDASASVWRITERGRLLIEHLRRRERGRL